MIVLVVNFLTTINENKCTVVQLLVFHLFFALNSNNTIVESMWLTGNNWVTYKHFNSFGQLCIRLIIILSGESCSINSFSRVSYPRVAFLDKHNNRYLSHTQKFYSKICDIYKSCNFM